MLTHECGPSELCVYILDVFGGHFFKIMFDGQTKQVVVSFHTRFY